MPITEPLENAAVGAINALLLELAVRALPKLNLHPSILAAGKHAPTRKQMPVFNQLKSLKQRELWQKYMGFDIPCLRAIAPSWISRFPASLVRDPFVF